MRRNTFLALILTGALALTACGASNSAAGDAGSTDERDTFVIGLEAGYAPFNWTQMDDGSGAVPIDGTSEFAGGYDVEIAKKVAEGLGKIDALHLGTQRMRKRPDGKRHGTGKGGV